MQERTRADELVNPTTSEPRHGGLTSALLALGLGTLLACLVALAGAGPGPPPPGPVVLWAADRDGGRVFGLDRDLFLAQRIPVDWPLDVEPAGDGGLWVLRSGGGTSQSTHRLDRFASDGALITELWLEHARDLDVLAGGEQALIVEAREQALTRLLRVRDEGSLFVLLERDGLACIAGERAAALVGTTDGTVLRVDVASASVVATAQLGGSIVDLAPGPERGTVWALDGAGTGRVLLLAPDLTVRWTVNLPRRAAHLAAVRGEERVWLANTDSACVLRYGPGGALELDRCGLPLPGLDRAVAWRDGLVVAAVGAILRLDASGNLMPGQGGFDALSDLAPRIR